MAARPVVTPVYADDLADRFVRPFMKKDASSILGDSGLSHYSASVPCSRCALKDQRLVEGVISCRVTPVDILEPRLALSLLQLLKKFSVPGRLVRLLDAKLVIPGDVRAVFIPKSSEFLDSSYMGVHA